MSITGKQYYEVIQFQKNFIKKTKEKKTIVEFPAIDIKEKHIPGSLTVADPESEKETRVKLLKLQ